LAPSSPSLSALKGVERVFEPYDNIISFKNGEVVTYSEKANDVVKNHSHLVIFFAAQSAEAQSLVEKLHGLKRALAATSERPPLLIFCSSDSDKEFYAKFWKKMDFPSFSFKPDASAKVS